MPQERRPRQTQRRLADLEAIANTVPDAASALTARGIAIKLNWSPSRVLNALVNADVHGYLFAEAPRGRIYLFSLPGDLSRIDPSV
jgi:hypothetical protein